ADKSGIVRYNIDVPQFSGDIRVMAYAYKGKGFGGADQHMKVADPVVISTALPRVLSPRDQVVMPVTLSNTTTKEAPATVTVTVAGPLGITGVASQKVTIPANREARAVFNVAALNSIGAGKVTVSVTAMNETFVDETEIGVRPPASLQKITGSGTVSAAGIASLSIPSKFLPGTAGGKLIIGKSPLVPFSKNLEYLVRYPHGCVEQTTSAAFPQLYYADLVKGITGTSSSDGNPGYNVQQAILKLQSMQLSNGALMYWPGGGSESWWGSIYATHFLLEAKKAGYEVNARTVTRWPAVSFKDPCPIPCLLSHKPAPCRMPSIDCWARTSGASAISIAEGNPKEQKFVDLVLETKPAQVTLVPDEIGQLTSNHGWDTA
ncbi:hypothetical protein OSTOST_06398, partial [Ostertagia ostertagi]